MRLLSALSVSCIPTLVFADVYSLSSLSWILRNGNGSIAVPAKVPSQAHLDLYAVGIIEDPLSEQNEYWQRWIVNDSWTYTADLQPFLRSVPQSPSQRTLLVFYGLDTVANITVTGHPVAWVNNQFRQYVYDVTDLINSTSGTDNNVTVAFESAYAYGLNVSTLAYEDPIVFNFEYENIRQYVRKTQSDWGWDWGPAFVPTGIFRPAYLVTLTDQPTLETSHVPAEHPLLASQGSAVLIDQSSMEISKVGQAAYSIPNQTADWLVNVTLGVRSILASPNTSVSINIPELNLSSGLLPVQSIPANTDESTFVTVAMTVPEGVPRRWWPTDLGSPKLYNFTIALTLGDANATLDKVSFTMRSGFRTIELLQTAYTDEEVATRGITPGDKWHFAVNGQDFYTKGTSVVPFDPFYARISQDKVRWILESAVQSGQNMVRVWGGGVYQPSDALTGGYDFYSLCDELGILAWSELIFSDALYPLNDFLLASIAPEVRENVRRVNKHPSNAQWAASNEIEGIALAVDSLLPDGKHYLDEFITLFQDYLHDLVFDVQQSVAYTDCSTTNGALSLNPYVLRLNNKTDGYIYGNTERYNYNGAQAFDYSTYPMSRFVDEFGFHSMPSFYTWEEVLTSSEDFAFNSAAVMAREHHWPAGSLAWPNPNAWLGQTEMEVAVTLWLPLPNTADANQTFAQWCYSTQVFQSMNMISEIAFYRRGAGRGENNLGALVWQMNDVWQAPSWAAVEYSGLWKVLNYGMTSIYTPVIIYPFWTPPLIGQLDVTVINDRPYEVNGTAVLTWYDWAGNELQPAAVHEFQTPALNNTVLLSQSGLISILPKGASVTNAWMLLNVTSTLADGRTVAMESYFTPISLALADLVDPQISMTHSENYTFTLSSKGGVAPYTWVDHPSGTVGYFVDAATSAPFNGFYLVPGIDRTLRFVLNKALTSVSQPDPADFVVRSVWNNTHV